MVQPVFSLQHQAAIKFSPCDQSPVSFPEDWYGKFSPFPVNGAGLIIKFCLVNEEIKET